MRQNPGVRQKFMFHGSRPREINTAAYRWTILLVTTGIQASIAYVSHGIGSFAPFLETDLRLNKSQVGFIGGAVNVGMTLTSLLAGRAVDGYGEKAVFIIGGLFTGAGVMWASRSNSFPVLLALLFFTGLWAASATPAGSKAIMSWFPGRRLGFALSVRQTGVPLGGLLAALSMPRVAMAFDWHTAMAIMGLIPISGAIICFFLYRVMPDGISNETNSLHQTRDTVVRSKEKQPWASLRNSNIWLVSFTSITFMAAQFTVLTYLILFLHDRVGLTIATASIFLGIAQFGGIIGRIFWGSVSDTVFRGHRRPAMACVGLAIAIMALSMLFLNHSSPVWLVGIMSWLLGFSALGWNGVHVVLISELAGKEHAGTAMGLSMTLLQIGVLAFPPIFGLFVDMTESYQSSWVALAILIVVGLLPLTKVKENKDFVDSVS